MAEKEERIMIIEVGEQCNYRGESSVSYFAKNGVKICTRQEMVCHKEDNWGAQCNEEWCKKCQHKDLVGIPKSEAIEKMAKAIFEKDNVLALDIRFDELSESKRNFYYSVAEAALNALLGVKK